jgi:hypothetical protein
MRSARWFCVSANPRIELLLFGLSLPMPTYAHRQERQSALAAEQQG